MRGSWRPNRTAIYWPPLLWPSALCFSFSWAAQQGAWGPSLSGTCSHSSIFTPTGLISKLVGGTGCPFCWVVAFSTTSYHQLIRPPTQSGVPKAPSAGWWLSLPQLASNSSVLQLPDFLSPPSYIIIQSPTQSLEWHVWLSSSGNNCHGVHKSLSSGASVYECTMGFYLVPFFQPSPPTRFLLITAIGMCHFLPVHHCGMACLAGSKVNIQQQLRFIWTIDSTLSGATTLGQRWQRRFTPHSPKLQHYWKLTIRLFSVLSRTLVEGLLPLTRDAVGCIPQLQPTGLSRKRS